MLTRILNITSTTKTGKIFNKTETPFISLKGVFLCLDLSYALGDLKSNIQISMLSI